MTSLFRVASKHLVATDVVLLTLRSGDGAPVPGWTPGAHIDLVVREGLERQYSLCGDPGNRFELSVGVLREPAGRGGSRFVHDELAVGDPVRVRGPRNNFALIPAPGYLFVAGGIGITPLLPMIRHVAAIGAEWALHYGGRTRTSMAFIEELEALGSERVTIGPEDETGRLPITEIISQAAPGTVVYCCGPAGLIAVTEQACQANPGVRLMIERFMPKSVELDGSDRAFEVELKRSGRIVPVPANRSLLEALETAGVEQDFSCREGTCGTCETAVLAGRPDHRDSLLTDAEKVAGEVIFPCVSRSLSARLVLDL